MRTTNATSRLPDDNGTAGDSDAHAVATTVQPLAVSITDACRITGMSRSELYRWLGAKKIRAVKRGVRTLILVDSLHQHFASLPPAQFRGTPFV